LESRVSWPFAPLQQWKYSAGMIDPAWPFDLWNVETGSKKGPQAQYRCMSIEEIEALPVEHLFRDGAFIGLWCTNPLVAKGVHARVLAAWRMEPITMLTWAKRTRTGALRWGTGYVARTVTEQLILASYGKHGIRNPKLPTLIDGLAREHSRKPDEVYAHFEKMTPNDFRCDLFARETRPGWEAWGNEANKFDGAAA
jgi:N6-adenosine-specific RNA methylase IME4